MIFNHIHNHFSTTNHRPFLASLVQADLSTFLSVRPSVHLSVCLSATQFSPCSSHHIIMKFPGSLPLTKVMSMQKVKVRGQAHRCHNKLWPTLMHKDWKGIEEVPYYLSRSSFKFQDLTGPKIADFDPKWALPDCSSSLNCLMAMK